MQVFTGHFREVLRSDVPLLDTIMRYIVKRKGKQMRPLFVFLTAKLHGEIVEKTHTAASLIELLHTATLVHDDVVDESNRRRGFFSIQALWKKKIAVLVGDYLLSRGLLTAVDAEAFDLLKLTSRAVKEMSEGELLQIEKARKLDITESVYFEIIRKKTATLIAACCEMGSQSVMASKAEVENMRQFGEYIGMAFQIKDDLFDYGTQKIGKPTGIDIKEQKMTLPLIHTLNNCSKKEKKWVVNSIKNYNTDKVRVKELIHFVKEKGGLDYAVSKMKEYQKMALVILQKYPDSTYKESLELMVNYVINRKK